MNRIAIVIPARFASTRLPGKPLADIHGKPMIQHVYERAQQVPNVTAVLVATDNEQVQQAVLAFGGQVVMTRPDHPSGTDRLTEVMQKVDADIYINVQGDEPLIRPSDIARLADGMRNNPNVQVGTLCHPIDAEEAKNPNTVKVVTAVNGQALYFSRSIIPFPRQAETATYLKHVGVYAYRREVLHTWSSLPQPMLEQTEMLEQLRLLHAGISICTWQVEPTGPGVDTPECLERVRHLLAQELGITYNGTTTNSTSPATDPSTTLAAQLANVRLVITDVDGVLTDGSILYNETGECMKRFHVRDGMGIRMLEENGIPVAVVSGRDSATLRKRIQDLGISLSLLGVKDKAQACLDLMKQAGVTPAQTACIGDDSIDLPAFAVCEHSFAVADAPDYVQRQAKAVLHKAGGQGAFRELSDAILNAQGKSDVYSCAKGYSKVMNNMAQ